MLQNKKYYLVAVGLIASLLLPAAAGAAQLSQASIRLGRLGISATTGNDLLVTFKLNTTPTAVSKIRVAFPTGFVITTGTPAVGTTGFPQSPTGITAPPGTLTAAATSGTRDIVVSGLTSASLNNTTLYGFTIPSGTIQNPATAGQYNSTVESQNSGGTTIDLTTTPVYITGATANADQVTVSASVAPNFNFSLSANADTVPQADSTSIKTSPGVNMVVGTNSPLGYTAYVKSANASLTSATSPATPITTGTFDGTPDTATPGTTNYLFVPTTGAAATSATGALTYNSEYNVGASGTIGGSFNTTNFASFVSRNGYTNADTVNLKERVTVANTIGYANDYTDVLTVVAAGNY
ncbi:hypothetical protein H7171_03610 [Candidatus Saccharibacteria bacterium]|nr:hypothetical protein [Candidatus Saccharibacteria bacterium]